MVRLGERSKVHQAGVQGVRQAALLVVLLEVRRGVLREIQGVLAAVLEVGVHRKEFLAGFSHLGVQKGSDEGRCHRRLGLGPGLPLPSAEGEGERRNPGGTRTEAGSYVSRGPTSPSGPLALHLEGTGVVVPPGRWGERDRWCYQGPIDRWGLVTEWWWCWRS